MKIARRFTLASGFKMKEAPTEAALVSMGPKVRPPFFGGFR